MPFGRLVAFPVGVAIFKCTDVGNEHMRELFSTNIMFVEESRPNDMLRVRVPSVDGDGFDNGIIPAIDVALWCEGTRYESLFEYEQARERWEKENDGFYE